MPTENAEQATKQSGPLHYLRKSRDQYTQGFRGLEGRAKALGKHNYIGSANEITREPAPALDSVCAPRENGSRFSETFQVRLVIP